MPKLRFTPRGGGGLGALDQWIGRLPIESDPVKSADALAQFLEYQRLTGGRPLERVYALQQLGDCSDRLIDNEAPRLTCHRERLSADALRLYEACDRLLDLLSRGLLDLAEAALRTPLSIRGRRMFEPTVRAGFHHASRRIRMALRARVTPTADAWRTLHALHALAVARGFVENENEVEPDSISRRYVGLLLMALAEPSKLTARNLDQVYFYLMRHGHLARLLAVTPKDTKRMPEMRDAQFFVVPSAGQATVDPLRVGDRTSEIRWILDNRELVTRLRQQLEQLLAGVAPQRLGLPKDAATTPYRALMQHLATAWGAPAPIRKFRRSRFLPRVDVAAGFRDCWMMIQALRADPEQRSLHLPAVGLWSITDESPVGIGLRWISGSSAPLLPGLLLALRPHGPEPLAIGFVQRVTNSSQHELEVGIELLDTAPQAITIRLPRLERGREQATHDLPVLLLQRAPAYLKDRNGVLAQTGTLGPGIGFTAPIAGSPHALRVGERIAHWPGLELFALDPFDPALPA